MDHAKSAQEVLKAVGGSENIVSAAHCATRLRLVIVDNSKVDKEALENVDGAKGVFEASGQLQIIFGTGTVNKVYAEFIKAAGISEASKDEAKAAAAQKQNIVMRGIKLLGDIFVPIIPAIVASGLLLGIMSALNFMNDAGYITLDTGSAFYNVVSLVSSTAFQFLQILIGYSAAKAFGANPYLGAVIGGILINPNMESAYNLAALSAEGAVPMMPIFGGLWSVEWVGYQGHVIPIVIACGILAFIEKRLHKVVPDAIDLFVTPLVSVFVTAYVVLCAVGPVFVAAENAVLYAVQWLLTLPLGIGSFIVGGLYAPTVVTGLHQMYTAIDLGQLAQYGLTYWLPIASAANIGQAGACLAVALKTRDAKIRSLALPSALSAFLGITEPAIFGVNLRFFKCFVAGCIGGACGALVCALTNLGAVGTGVTGVFGILLCLNQPVQYLIMFAVAAVVSFVISFALYSDNGGKKQEKQEELELEASAQEVAVADEISDAITEQEIVAPVTGTVVASSEIADPTFAAEILGPTVAIEPDTTEKYFTVEAPVEGVVSTVFETGHAVGITGVSGVEILLHIGIDTVKLGGKGFTALCEEGQRVKLGDALVKVEPAVVKAAGYPLTTMTIVSNGYDFNVEKLGVPANVPAGMQVMDAKRNA